MIPAELQYTAEHEWIRTLDSGNITFGITHFAQDSLGDIVYVSLPGVGAALTAGQPCGEVESTKSVSDIYAPVSGEVVAVNVMLDGAPETINADPYGDGWMVEVAPVGEVAGALSASEYQALTDTQ